MKYVREDIVVATYVSEKLVTVRNEVLSQLEGVVVFADGSFAVRDEDALRHPLSPEGVHVVYASLDMFFRGYVGSVPEVSSMNGVDAL